MQSFVSIKELSGNDRPREKLSERGRSALTDSELLAIIISSGTRNRSALDLSREVLKLCDNNLTKLASYSVADLCQIDGIGKVKAISILASLELANRRLIEVANPVSAVRNSQEAFACIRGRIEDLGHEEFWMMTLNRKNTPIGTYKISEGGITSTVVDQRRIFKIALDDRCTSIIVFHNHPSGSCTPSSEDNALTHKLADAGKLLDIKVLDHVVVGRGEYYSYADSGLM